MDSSKHLRRSQLFLVRLWPEEEREGEVAWCGSVQDPLSGRAHSFRGCPEMMRVMLAMIPGSDGERTMDSGPARGEWQPANRDEEV